MTNLKCSYCKKPIHSRSELKVVKRIGKAFRILAVHDSCLDSFMKNRRNRIFHRYKVVEIHKLKGVKIFILFCIAVVLGVMTYYWTRFHDNLIIIFSIFALLAILSFIKDLKTISKIQSLRR